MSRDQTCRVHSSSLIGTDDVQLQTQGDSHAKRIRRLDQNLADTGHNSTGNGGDAYYSGGTITSRPKIDFDGDNKVEKANVGDDVHQTNKLWADQSVNVYIGGGDGGDGNMVVTGNVDINLDHFIV